MDTLRPHQATRHGMSKTTLSRLAHQGKYENFARGLYRRADAPPADHDFLEASIKRPDAIMCLTSALAHHELIDDIPIAADMAIPRPACIPATKGAIRWHL